MRKHVFLCGLTLLLVAVLLTPEASAANFSNERQIFDYITQDMGLNTAAACGILANIEAESGFRTDCYGDRGTSYGLCQWHNARFGALRSFCTARGLDYSSLEGQLQFLDYELRAHYSNVYSLLRTVPNTSEGAYQAGYGWCYYYEVPASRQESSQRRGRNAQMKYWLRYGDGSFSSDPYANSDFSGFGPDAFGPLSTPSFYWEESEETEETSAETQPEEYSTQPESETVGTAKPHTPPRSSGPRRLVYVPHRPPVSKKPIPYMACLFLSAGPYRKDESLLWAMIVPEESHVC